jgi:hypothetical protein
MAKSPAAKPDVTLADNEQGQPAGDKVTVALDAQLSLIAWLQTYDAVVEFRRFAGAYARPDDDVDYTMRRGDFWREVAAEYVGGSPTYYVTGEMCRVSAAAAADLEPCPVLLPYDLPSQSGFVYFAAAPRFTDYTITHDVESLWGIAPKVRAISWKIEEIDAQHPGRKGFEGIVDDEKGFEGPLWDEGAGFNPHAGISYYFWVLADDVVADLAEAERVGFDTPTVAFPHVESRPTAESVKWVRKYLEGKKWLPFEMSAWGFGISYVIGSDVYVTGDERNVNVAEGPVIYGPIEWQRRYMTALWALMQQEIVIVEHGKMDRAAWRRLKRQQERQPEFGDIKIVRLRRAYNPVLEMVGEDDISHRGEVEWTHRWPVRGHWRNQPFGPGRSQRRRVWIPPYVKGPQDKPLVIKDTIWSLER